jgi:hypothetical protein
MVNTGSATLQTEAFYLSTLSFTKINNTLPMVDERNVRMKHWRNDKNGASKYTDKTYPCAILPKIPQGLVRDKTRASTVGRQRATASARHSQY